MTPDSHVSPQSLSRFLASTEFKNRYLRFPEQTISKVIRYGSSLGSIIECHDKISRCMHRLQQMIDEAENRGGTLPSGTVVLAHELVKGSGRFDRYWHAPKGGLWLAIAWADTLLPEYTGLLPLAAGTACCEAVRNYDIDARLKWVNDIHVNGLKLGGILCETFTAKPSGDRYHLIGIGINCNVETFPDELRNTAVSMHKILGFTVDLDRFALNLLASLTWNLGLVHLQEERDLASREGEPVKRIDRPLVLDAWLRLSDSLGRRVRYGYDVVRRPLYQATVQDIDHMGGLVMQLDDGTQLTEYSGEIIYLNDDISSGG